MEAVAKKYFWTLNLFFIALGAWLIANMLNVVFAHKLLVIPNASKGASKPKSWSYQNKRLESNQIVIDRNYFGSALSKPEEGPNIDESSAEKLLNGDGIESSIRASLVGTIVADEHSEWSMAMITDLTSAETGVYRIHDTLMEEAEIVAILSRRVVINRGGSYEYIELQEKANPKTSIGKPSRPNRKSTSKTEVGEGIRKVGKDTWSIERNEIDKTLSNLNSIAMQARIVPSFKNGESNGFKLFAIRPGSLYSKLGIQNGDIIHKINGFPINSPDKALEVYQKLKNARSVEIDLTRRGKNQKLNYRIE